MLKGVMPEVIYKGKVCLIVYVIPEKDRNGKHQGELSYYLSYPFDKIVTKKDFDKSKEILR
jgi:hypothetical protein